MAVNVVVVARKDANGEMQTAESLVKQFKKAVLKAGVLKECRKREYFVKKAVKRRLKSEEYRKSLKGKKH